MRGQSNDYDYWKSLGNNGWGWDDVLPIFKKSEDYQHGADHFHGSGGELRVEERRVNWEILDAWRNAAEECGIEKISEFNRGDNSGCAYFQMNQKRGKRWSATSAYLKPIINRKNLTILTKTVVHRINFQKNDSVQSARSVEIRSGNDTSGKAEIFAKKEIILSAGSIGSPQLLQLSGIGNSNNLSKLGIKSVMNLPGVGENLHDHLQLRSIYSVENTKTLNSRFNSIFGKISMGLEYLIFKTGPLTMPPSQLGAFAKSHSSKAHANLEWHVQPLSLDKFGSPLHKFDGITPAVCNLQPTSRGSVQITSSEPTDYPKIVLNYLSSREDEDIAVSSLKYTRRIMKAKCLERFHPQEILPGPEIESDVAILDAAREIGTTIFHPVGTCKMGSDKMAVVNDRLKVHGINNLRVIDASIMPRITSGNTNAPTVMIAEKGADLVLQDSNSGF